MRASQEAAAAAATYCLADLDDGCIYLLFTNIIHDFLHRGTTQVYIHTQRERERAHQQQ
jgi:hypothetical protein